MKKEERQYIRRKETYDKLQKKQSQTLNFISILRLVSFICAIIFAYIFYNKNMYYLSAGSIVVFITLFIVLIKKHNKMLYNKKCSQIIAKINEESEKRLQGQWKCFEDSGEEFIDEKHRYSKDLDVFGKNSLFQYINSAVTYLGRRKLKDVLTDPKYNVEEIENRQKAVIELGNRVGWRQRFMAEGRMLSKIMEDPADLFKWSAETNYILNRPLLIALVRVLPIITIILIILCFTTKLIPYYIPEVAIVIHIVIFKINSKEINKRINLVYKYKKELEVYSRMLKLIEKSNFKCKTLNDLKKELINEDNYGVTKHIEELIKIANSISNRENMAYIPINIITFWDYQCLIALEKWKETSGSFVNQWLRVIADIEVLSSLSVTKKENSNWVMPKVRKYPMEIEAKHLGHPLLGEKRICNDLEVGKKQKVLLITGSNMSGKSTFLRTVGINLVLAYTGAAVCAEEFCCSIMNIHTCMRTGDNLEQNISSFYAELLRVKNIVDAAKKKEPIFFLLDEIFKGTNSKDRHIGAEVLIDTLSRENAIGFVSTHDLELGDMENKNDKIKNYHFREYYKNDEIYFDYKLKSGVSVTRNALYLMKLVGINVKNEDKSYL